MIISNIFSAGLSAGLSAGAKCPNGMRKSRAGCISKGSRSPGARMYRKSAGKVYGRPRKHKSPKASPAKSKSAKSKSPTKSAKSKSAKLNTLAIEDNKKKEQYLRYLTNEYKSFLKNKSEYAKKAFQSFDKKYEELATATEIQLKNERLASL